MHLFHPGISHCVYSQPAVLSFSGSRGSLSYEDLQVLQGVCVPHYSTLNPGPSDGTHNESPPPSTRLSLPLTMLLHPLHTGARLQDHRHGGLVPQRGRDPRAGGLRQHHDCAPPAGGAAGLHGAAAQEAVTRHVGCHARCLTQTDPQSLLYRCLCVTYTASAVLSFILSPRVCPLSSYPQPPQCCAFPPFLPGTWARVRFCLTSRGLSSTRCTAWTR